MSSRTRQAYNTGLSQFLNFASLHNVKCSVDNLPDISENFLLLFVTYCYKHLGLSATTIQLYLAGIRFSYLEAGHRNPLKSCFGGPHEKLNLLLKAITRHQGQHQNSRLPITSEMIDMMSTALKKGLFTPYLDCMLHAVILVAFFGFMRCGEFTTYTSHFDRKIHLCVEDINFCTSNQAKLTLKTSKTDQFRKGCVLTLFQNNRFCPILALKKYLQLRKQMSMSTQPGDPLFAVEDGRPLTRSFFIKSLRSLIDTIGVDSSKYSGHSFRIGAASSAAQVGIQDHMIKTLGRWSSDTYYRYIRVADKSLHAAQSALAYSS